MGMQPARILYVEREEARGAEERAPQYLVAGVTSTSQHGEKGAEMLGKTDIFVKIGCNF